MKKTLYSISLIATLSGCSHSTLSHNDSSEQSATDTVSMPDLNQLADTLHPGKLFTLPDAEKIMGEQAHLADSALINKGNIVTYRCAYLANAKDSKSGKTGSVYFLFEKYDQITAAQKKYSSVKSANETHEGVKAVQGVGDEAYFHSDGQNFYFIMVRKGEKVFNMKVNKITSKTSLDALNTIAKNIANAI